MSSRRAFLKRIGVLLGGATVLGWPKPAGGVCGTAVIEENESGAVLLFDRIARTKRTPSPCMDIRDVLSDNSVMDMLAEEDEALCHQAHDMFRRGLVCIPCGLYRFGNNPMEYSFYGFDEDGEPLFCDVNGNVWALNQIPDCVIRK